MVLSLDGKGIISRIRAEAKRRGLSKDITLVVDFIHVLEYLWDAAWCFFEEGDKEVERWVTERAFAVLQGRSSDVAAGIRRSATLRELPSDKRVGAEAILRLRSLRSSGDFDDYWAFHLDAEHARNHTSRYAADKPKLRLLAGGASS